MANDWEVVGMSDMWDFKKDKEVMGIYVRLRESVGENKSNIYTLKSEEGSIGVWGSAVLDSRFDDIEIGEEVKIIYKGQGKNPKSGRTYHDFEVFRRQAPFKKVEKDDVDLDDILKTM